MRQTRLLNMFTKVLKNLVTYCFSIFLIFRRYIVKTDNSLNFYNSKTLVIIRSGLGNTIMSLPLVATITRNSGSGIVDILTNNEASKVVLNSVKNINNIIIYRKKFIEKIKLLYNLRKKKISILFSCLSNQFIINRINSIIY